MKSVLREITFATVRDILALEVSPEQRSYVATNATSLAEAHFNPGAWFRAVYAGATPVGFVLLLDPTRPGALSRGPLVQTDIFLWRLMIDYRYQKRGYASRALDLVRQHVRENTNAVRLITSYVEGPDGPKAFYLRYGFQPTGQLRGNGTEVELWIKP